jgi:hypothetical protein
LGAGIYKKDLKYRQICWWEGRISVGLAGAIGRKIEILLQISCGGGGDIANEVRILI